MNIIYLKDETYLRAIAIALKDCGDKTVIIVGEERGMIGSAIKELPLKNIPITAMELCELNIKVAERLRTRKPWRERPKF